MLHRETHRITCRLYKLKFVMAVLGETEQIYFKMKLIFYRL